MAIVTDNLLKRSYGGLYVTGGAATQNTSGTPGVFVKLTQFATDGAHSDLIIPSNANDWIKVYKSGIYLAHFTMTFDPGSSDTFTFQVHAGASGAVTPRANVTAATKVQAPSDYCNCSGFGFISLNTYDVVELHVACSGATKAVAVKFANLAILRVAPV